MTACTDKVTSDEDVILPDPATKDVAVSIAFDKGKTLYLTLPERTIANDPSSAKPDELAQVDIAAIDLTEDSRYVLYIKDKDLASKAAPMKYAEILMGRYIFDKGFYTLSGFGDLRIEEGRCIIKPVLAVKAQVEEIVVSASVTKFRTSSWTASNLARNWKIEKTRVTVDNMGSSFSGCDFGELARAFKKQFNISDDEVKKLEGYQLYELNFIGNNNMVMNFTVEKSYYGTCTLNGEKLSWELSDSNKFIPKNATGSFKAKTNNKATITVNTNLAKDYENHKVKIEFEVAHID